MSHAELEAQLVERGREVLRQAQQDHLDRREATERLLPEVVDADGVGRSRLSRGGVGGWRRCLGRCGWGVSRTGHVAVAICTRLMPG